MCQLAPVSPWVPARLPSPTQVLAGRGLRRLSLLLRRRPQPPLRRCRSRHRTRRPHPLSPRSPVHLRLLRQCSQRLLGILRRRRCLPGMFPPLGRSRPTLRSLRRLRLRRAPLCRRHSHHGFIRGDGRWCPPCPPSPPRMRRHHLQSVELIPPAEEGLRAAPRPSPEGWPVQRRTSLR